MILALHAASPVTSIWLSDAPTEAHPSLEWESGRTLADGLLGQIDALVSHANVKLDAISGIVIFSGPGSFTSLRIGHTIANTLGEALGIPVVGAQGDTWLDDALKLLEGASASTRALPFYGSEATITQRKS